MKEITRIHIAKTAYDIEIGAKKELETYISALERYAEDPSILEDIEIRITELLQEHGTTKDDVITTRDIAVVRERLGEPQDFAEDSDVAALPADSDARPRRRLYRDQDTAVLGGVLSGIATYFGINPLWTRLVFILLLIMSFGTMAIVYIVLWIVLPPARTAAEKLELEGKPVTLAAIKARSERLAEDVTTSQTAKTVQQVLLFCAGLLFSIIAVISLIGTVIAAIMVLGIGNTEDWRQVTQDIQPIGLFWLSYALCILSGLLFAALNAILAVATFSRTWTKRIGIAVVAIILAGIITFSSAVGGMMYGTWQTKEDIRQSTTTTKQPLSKEFSATKKLIIDASAAPSFGAPTVVYVPVEGKPYAQVAQMNGSSPQFNVTQDGEVATITVKTSKNWSMYPEAPVTIYGPALDEFTVNDGIVKYATDTRQGNLSVIAKHDGLVTIEGKFDAVDARTETGSTIELGEASVRSLRATTNGGDIKAGVVRTADVSQPDSCPASDDDENEVVIKGVSSRKITYNKSVQSVHNSQTIKTACGAIIIGNHEE